MHSGIPAMTFRGGVGRSLNEESEAMRALYPSLTRKMSRMKPKLEKRRRNVLVRFRHA
jgi:hypothetical protein